MDSFPLLRFVLDRLEGLGRVFRMVEAPAAPEEEWRQLLQCDPPILHEIQHADTVPRPIELGPGPPLPARSFGDEVSVEVGAGVLRFELRGDIREVRQFQILSEGIAKRICRENGLDPDGCKKVGPNLFRLRHAHEKPQLFFLNSGLVVKRVLDVPQVSGILRDAVLLSPRDPPAMHDPSAELEKRGLVWVSLLDNLRKGEGLRLSLGAESLSIVTESSPDGITAARDHGEAWMTGGWRRLTRAEYDALLGDRNRFGMFVDFLTGKCHKKVGDAVISGKPLSLLQQSRLTRVLRSGASCGPAEARMIQDILTRIDSKKDGQRRGRIAFRVQSGIEKGSAPAYLFEPPEELDFCFVFPLNDR